MNPSLRFFPEVVALLAGEEGFVVGGFDLFTRLLVPRRRPNEHVALVRIGRTGWSRLRLSVDRALKLAGDEMRAA